MKPKVSIVIPVYKAENYIAVCAKSLFEQIFDDIEFIFVDDGSPDNSILVLERVLEGYPLRKQQVKIIRHQHNQGVAVARNTGLRNASGDYIGWCDADDWVSKDMVGELYAAALTVDADIVWSDFFVCYSNSTCRVSQKCLEDSDSIVKALLYGHLHGSLCFSLVKYKLYKDNNITFPIDKNVMEDKLVSIKLRCFANTFKYVPKAYYYYNRLNSSSITTLIKMKDIDGSVSNMDSIINFLFQCGRLDINSPLIPYSKLAFKDYYVNLGTLRGFILWKNIFPEANSYVLKSPTMSVKAKVLGWLIHCNCWGVLKSYLKMKKIFGC